MNTARANTTVAITAPVANLKALNYKNSRVVERLVQEDGLTHDEAEVLFEDTLKFLALTGNGVKLSPSPRIDLGWHNFILHTKDYADFCQECFGHFIHHEPGSGLTHQGLVLDVVETAELAQRVYGKITPNWNGSRGATCGSGGC